MFLDPIDFSNLKRIFFDLKVLGVLGQKGKQTRNISPIIIKNSFPFCPNTPNRPISPKNLGTI